MISLFKNALPLSVQGFRVNRILLSNVCKVLYMHSKQYNEVLGLVLRSV